MSHPTPTVDTAALEAALARGATVIDVREPGEYLDGHVPGALPMPMSQLAARVGELDRESPVHVICASGNRSAAMTDFLQQLGFTAYNVAGGTQAWVRSGRPVTTGTAPGGPAVDDTAVDDTAADDTVSGTAPTVRAPQIVTLDTPSLGDRSYLVHDGEVAFVVDPQRDIDRVLALLEEHGVRLTHVFETHLHNDYVTGGLALAEHTGASYHVNGEDTVSFDRTPVRDGDVVEVGATMRVRAVATPGHTFTHLSYVLLDQAADGGTHEQVAVFTGGSLLYGATGRPDLLGPTHTDELVRLQHASAHRLADTLPDDAGVFPTHGFGSFCSATQTEATESTIGQEKRANPALTQDEETYVRELLDGLGAYPAYYAHMGPANAGGPSAPDLSAPSQADPAELRRRIEEGEWVVDLRNRQVFAAGHVRGTLNFGLDGAFSTYVGWLIDWGTPLTLLGETAADVATAQRELVRIGIDRPAAAATGGPEVWTDGEVASFPVATFADLAQVRHHRPVTVLDVRRAEEHAAARIEGAVNIPIHELPWRLDEVPGGPDHEVWVHCAGGYRASVAASFLDAAGVRLVAVDDSFDNARTVGLHLVGPEAS